MNLTRFHVLHRRFIRMASTDLSTVDPETMRRMIVDADAYLSAPREPELGPEYSPFYVRAALRTTGLRILENSAARAWRPQLADLLERLPSEERLPNGARFSSDFVTLNARYWRPALIHLADKPDLNGLEVGSFEGRSCIWFLSTILTHPSSRMTCIDTFDFGGQGRGDISDRNLQDRFDENVAAAGFAGRVTKRFGSSQEQLRTLPFNHFDFAYIDGSHLTCDVLEDVVLVWRLLRPGAILILDDYGYRRNHENDPTVRPDVAIDAFMTCFAGQWSAVHRGYQIILRKEAAA